MSAQLEYIEQQIGEDIAFFSRRQDFNRQAAFLFTIVPAALSAFATVAIGTAEKLHLQWLPILAMAATAIASILGAWQALFAVKIAIAAKRLARNEKVHLATYCRRSSSWSRRQFDAQSTGEERAFVRDSVFWL